MHLLRARGATRVTNIELFFDLVFVYGVTQLSHLMLHDFSVLGAVETLILFLAVWYVWICTSWVTNWLDPDRVPVRLCLFVLMLGGLVLAVAIPQAFGTFGLLFALTYVGMQFGRSLFMVWAIGTDNSRHTRNFQRIASWFFVSGIVWIIGAELQGTARLVTWAIALVIDYTGPSMGFAVPGLGRSTTADWDVAGGHIAERCSLFVLIALGESVVVTGSVFAEAGWTFTTWMGLAASFGGTLAMWWIYFDRSMEEGSEKIEAAEDPGRLARMGYTYLHLPLVAGIVLWAVADDRFLSAADEHDDGLLLRAVIIGGPLLFLVGALLFKRVSLGRWRLSHLAGLLALVLLVLAPAGPLPLGGLAAIVLIVVAVWESVSLGSRRPKGQAPT
jgi:low temperature requirement protein LtrA